MNRDNVLFLLIGLLGGFLTGYLAHEAMRGVQPARLAPGGVSAAAAPASTGVPSPDAAAPSAGGAPMEEINRLRAALEQNPNDTAAILKLANFSFDIQRWERAGELYARYLELVPGDPDVMTDLGITFRARGEFDRALELFREAQAKNADHWQSRFNEVVVLAFDRKDFAGARRALAELERKWPGNPDVARLADQVRTLEGGG